MIGFDPLYLIMLAPVLLFSLWASARVKSSFTKYSQVRSQSGITGAEAAMRILRAYDLHDVRVEQTSGWLSDHYSPAERVLRLSEAVYGSSSIAAIGVAAHEAGHALQHGKGYAVMGLWQMLAKPAAIGSNLSYWLIIAGALLTSFQFLMIVGVILFGVVVLFQIVTLPLEFNASSRAKKLIVEMGILGQQEAAGVSRVLGAAAMTYVAAAISSVTTMLYYLIRFGILGSRD
ncbi:MAG: zinc metallopeptidase [Spirochaetota bacterium]|nr:zinc metallopeptidase [Spirochaetota bacterium]